MARKIISLRPQKQVDQAIKNFILDKSHARKNQVNICLGGGTSIHLMISSTGVRAYRMYKSKYVFLGYYFSEELVTDPELVDYEMPPDPYFTYDEILKRGEEVRVHGAPLGDDDFSQITNVNVTRPATRIGRPKVHRQLLEPAPKPAEKIKPVEEELEKPEASAPVAIKANDEYTESLKRRLRLLDLKIEREEILNKLATIENYERIS